MSRPEHSTLRYAAKRIRRAALRWAIEPLVRWTPLAQPADGFTVLVGCTRRLERLIPANLRMIARQRAPSLREVILVIDCVQGALPADVVRRIEEAGDGLRVRYLYYGERQARKAASIDWGWVYAWLSWCIGIGACETRYAMLHDFDAILLDSSILEERYRLIRERGVEYLGVGYYEGLGVLASDGLVKTFELVFDAQFVRAHFRPIELFNTMATYRGRRVEFDTFLNAQRQAGTAAIEPLADERIVHPSQMICQFTDHVSGRHRTPKQHNLLMVPYYEFLGGDDSRMRDACRQLSEDVHAPLRIWGSPLDVKGVGAAHASWLRAQAYRVEASLRPAPDPIVTEYFDAIERAVAADSTAQVR